MSQMFRGIGVALVTPFRKNGSLDMEALARLVNSVIKGGVDFIVALGTTAETPTLTEAERKEVLACVVATAADRVPVICGIGGNNTAQVAAQVKEYESLGIAGIMSVTPYYNRPEQEGLYQHFKAVADSTEKPVILYNVPGRTGSNLLPATAIRLANACKNVVAVKEASGNMAQCMTLIQDKPDSLAVLSGDDALALAQMAIGMDGVISVAANCFAKEFTELVNLAIVGKYDKARKVHYKLLPGINLLFAEGNPAGVKCVLHQMGICENVLRLPLTPVSAQICKQVTDYLAKG